MKRKREMARERRLKRMREEQERNSVQSLDHEFTQDRRAYLDDDYVSHLSQVRIVHGKGSGILRDMVHSYLKKLKYVKSFRLGEFGEGDSGVTVVYFKE